MDIRNISTASHPAQGSSAWKGLGDLSKETKIRICEIIQARGDRDTLDSLGAASKEFFAIVTDLIQQTVTLEPTDVSIRHLRVTIGTPELARRARRIVIKSVPSGFNELGVRPHEFPGRHGTKHQEDWVAAVTNLHRLPRLDSVVLTFTPRCAGERDDPDEEQPVRRICEPPVVRNWILAVVFDGLAAINHRPGRRIVSLTVINLQNKIHEAASLPTFAAVVSRLRELRVEVVTEVVPRLNTRPGEKKNRSGYWELDMQIRLNFWADFNRFWLAPAQATLRLLAVSCSDPFGVVPRWNLSGLHFPRLWHLELEKVTFSYRSQVEWIAAHKTLRTLWLHNCPIAQQWRTSGAYQAELDVAALVLHSSRPHTM
ncbi:hypothetical protein PpBr36_05000 [Pyricularia pennisetigena]|uniref:hypothetical protein n=1 Tax=Pyricularia pennisetigena TaxID=1578925 RepID=UPI001153B6EC|nr:hypothetical protein PpBr36_05000 [Pyricularia pennisetigena]TLS26147.1 hypothetical protein PpBr36_05000 [Pyricularia pennisetigena]